MCSCHVRAGTSEKAPDMHGMSEVHAVENGELQFSNIIYEH